MVWDNPFNEVVFEDWYIEKHPENYFEVVKCFIRPDFMEKLESIDVRPKIIMGGRGSGKSHILNMLSIESVLTKIKIEKSKELNKSVTDTKISLKDIKVPYFGVGIRCYPFSKLLSRNNVSYLEEKQLEVLFEHFFNMVVCSEIIKSVKFLIENVYDAPENIEKDISLSLSKNFPELFNDSSTFDEINKCIKSQTDTITAIIKELPFYKDFSKFKDRIYFTSAPDFIIEFFSLVISKILPNKFLFILLDEYEELDDYQQRFINKLIRTRKITLRIASQVRGIKTFEYASGKEIEEEHDYDPVISLHFDEHSRSYKELVRKIFEKRLEVHGNYRIKDPKKILQDKKDVSEEEIEKELANIYSEINARGDFQNSEYEKHFREHYKESARYRILKRKGKDPLFCGFDTYVKLSGGLIRQFILLCREVFSIAHVKGVKIEDGEHISPKYQTKAAEQVAKDLLENEALIHSSEGVILKQLVYDLGRILEYKVYNTSEPQCNLFQLNDSNRLLEQRYMYLNKVLEEGLKLPHFLSEAAFRPKQRLSSIPSFTFRINPIFMPILKVPFQKRWRLFLSVEELHGLCTSDHEKSLRRILSRISKGKVGKIPTSTLFQRQITLSNCPVTGGGCKENLMKKILMKNNIHCFLAVSFERDWISDIRKWLKEILRDDFQIHCIDVDDFPQVGYILCKICSCVRQMPVGIFEITELNPNVIFELGMATALNTLTFILVYKEQIPKEFKDNFPPPPLSGIEYIPYDYGKNPLRNIINEKILPTVKDYLKHHEKLWCWLIKGKCPYEEIEPQNRVLVVLPVNRNKSFFDECKNSIKKIINNYGSEVVFVEATSSLNEICQICQKIKQCSFCIIDTSYNDYSTVFSLGLAFGMDKKFIHLFNESLSGPSSLPLSDLRNWTITYHSLGELEERLKEEIQRRWG